MGLNMRGHVSGPFVSHRGVQRMRFSSEIVDFEPKLTQTLLDTFDANVQPASDKEIEFLQIGAERINDIRVIHRNDGKGIEVSTPGNLADILVFAETPDQPATWWKAMATDYRPWHNFCRVVIAKLDPAEIEKLQGYANG
ncbi:TPA: hypothetical protein QEM49_005058 [Pseudomonas putida]|uniref:hypothetical protein n=1 Tax=Pseudomonas putida TaxID=303 RepID=UPI002363E6CA|nr:hypothetical protein [Pseudomonas putida]MDD2012402.1 hypothetical protein [Pseudomonas putida]HDS1780475.1 hypothetical protein [Pseudomonas putida]